MSFVDVGRAVHIGAGVVALLSFAVPMVAPKGGRLHRKAGWVYVVAMAVVAASALALCVYRLIDHPSRGQQIGSTFLMYVSVLAAASTSAGVRVLRAKNRTAPHRHPWDLGLAAALVLSALAILAYGIALRQPLLAGFAPVGLFVGGGQLAYWLRRPRERMHWWYEHMGQMIGACTGTLTAFFVVNAPSLGLSQYSLAAWLAPAAVLTPVSIVWTRYYRRRFEPELVSAPDRRALGRAGRAV